MPVVACSNQVRIAVAVGDDAVTFVCRRPTGREVSQFLNTRFVSRRNKIETRLYEARQAFVDGILIDVENAQYQNAQGELVTLNAAAVLSEEDKRHCSGILGAPVDTWKDLIPLNWKSAAAMHFEDSQAGEEAEGN